MMDHRIEKGLDVDYVTLQQANLVCQKSVFFPDKEWVCEKFGI